MADLQEALATFWGIEGARITPLTGGMNSRTWSVEHQGSTYVAKSVPATALADLAAGAGELRHLDLFRRVRAAVQGVYFAGRVAADDLTGGIDPAENTKGLDDARRLLTDLGVT